MDCHSYCSDAFIPQTLKAARNPETLFLLASLIATHPLSLFKHLSKAAFSDYLSSHSTHFILIACLQSVSRSVSLTAWDIGGAQFKLMNGYMASSSE